MQEILDGTSTHYRKNAEFLLNKMKQHWDVTAWDYRGMYTRGPTYRFDLVKGALQHQARIVKQNPNDWNKFMSAMAYMKVLTVLLSFVLVLKYCCIAALKKN